MKKLKLILFGASLFLLASCGSKAPAETETTPEAPVEVEQVEETETTENTETEETTEPETPQDSSTANETALAALNTMRDKAIESGAEKTAPELFAELEDLYSQIQERAANGEDVTADCARLSMLYDALAAYSKAVTLKEKIDDQELYEYDQKNYDNGVLFLEQLEELFESEDATEVQLQDLAAKAYSSFNSVYFAAYRKLAKEARESAYAAKKNADSVKAAVSQKERYNEAADIFKTADATFAMQNPERACDLYMDAEDLFYELYEEVSEKRAAAQAAIEAAKAKVAESKQVALEADEELPITDENLEGIEDEDAVLLEEDDYEDPEEAEADIAETFEEEVINTVINAVEYLEAE